MDELLVLGELRVLVELLLQEILHSLHIVIGRRLDRLDPLCVLQRELVENLIEEGLLLKDELDVFLALSSDLLLKEALEPFDLDEDSVFHQSVFGEVLPQVM